MTTVAENSSPGTRRRYPRALSWWTGLGRGLGGKPARSQRKRAPRTIRERRFRADIRPRANARDVAGVGSSRDIAIWTPKSNAGRWLLAGRGRPRRRDNRRQVVHQRVGRPIGGQPRGLH